MEESNGIPEFRGKNLKENANNLKIQVKAFGEQLEEARENLEDCTRCFQLSEATLESLEKENEIFEDFKKVTYKTGNEKLIEKFKVRCFFAEVTRYVLLILLLFS